MVKIVGLILSPVLAPFPLPGTATASFTAAGWLCFMAFIRLLDTPHSLLLRLGCSTGNTRLRFFGSLDLA